MSNLFGGKNAQSLYVPMSEVEQEALLRLVESRELRVHVVGWGIVMSPRVTFGDARLTVAFRLDFDRPEVPMAVPYFDLELRTGSGSLLYRDRVSTEYGGQPALVAAGVCLDLAWDIHVKAIDPAVVKALVPSAVGLTSRRQDRDTGVLTEEGNMRLTPHQRKALAVLRAGEARAKAFLRGKVRKSGG